MIYFFFLCPFEMGRAMPQLFPLILLLLHSNTRLQLFLGKNQPINKMTAEHHEEWVWLMPTKRVRQKSWWNETPMLFRDERSLTGSHFANKNRMKNQCGVVNATGGPSLLQPHLSPSLLTTAIDSTAPRVRGSQKDVKEGLRLAREVFYPDVGVPHLPL